jgi:hypothetical protein
MNPVEQKEVADKAFFRYPETSGLLWVLNIICNKVLKVTRDDRACHIHPVYSTDSAGHHTPIFYLAKVGHKFSEVVDLHRHEQY